MLRVGVERLALALPYLSIRVADQGGHPSGQAAAATPTGQANKHAHFITTLVGAL